MGVDKSPGTGALHQLNDYWTKGEGLAKWATNPRPWTTLHALLVKYMSDGKAKGLTTEYFVKVFGHGPRADH